MVPSSPMLNFRFVPLLWAIVISHSLVAALLIFAASPIEPLNIVVTIPVLKDLTEQVGGSYVRVTSLLSGYENEHTYSPKPSDLVAVRKARLLFEVGIGLEVWVSSLVKNAGSASLLVVTTSKGIPLLRDTEHEGTAHAGEEGERGNPHVWMDPENAMTMLQHIADALIAVDPAHATEYRANQAAYLRKLAQLRVELSERVARVTDRRFIAHHPAWPYFARRFGFQIVGTIQPQSGSEPSALQLHGLIATIKKDRIKVVVSEVQLSRRIPELLSKETGARVVVLTTLPGGLPHTDTYLDMLRYNVLQLANALEGL
ncbi:MAG: metal ABC transporter substrate-binding protein [Nitrospirae bacterium]|nr:metal ABC transporter substrate-binding protein [Nitrospirota bacterium]